MKQNKQLCSMLAQPWSIRAASMAVIMESVGYADQQAIDLMLIETDDSEPYEIEDGVAVIKVQGVIGKKIPKIIAQIFGMTDVDEITDMVRLANADPEVSAIMLDIDSPGGTVIGVPELAATVRNSGKMTLAYSDNLMASAAYWIAAGASGVFASESALVGSIGVFTPIADMRRMYEMAGIEMEIIKSGEFKGAAWPGTSLSRAQRDDLQRGVEHIYGKFRDFAASRNGANPIPVDAMQGQDFYGDQAIESGIIDGTMSRTEAINALREMAQKLNV